MVVSYLGRWDLVQLRCANFMSCMLEERLALILLELSENFGVKDKHRTRLTLPTRHKDLADLVGASRPRVTETLIRFERDRFYRARPTPLERRPRSTGEFPCSDLFAYSRDEGNPAFCRISMFTTTQKF